MITNRPGDEPTLTILPADPFNGSAPLFLKTGRCVALRPLEVPAEFWRRIFPGLTASSDAANTKTDWAMEFALKPPW